MEVSEEEVGAWLGEFGRGLVGALSRRDRYDRYYTASERTFLGVPGAPTYQQLVERGVLALASEQVAWIGPVPYQAFVISAFGRRALDAANAYLRTMEALRGRP
jgi:hypothetical protein